MLRRLLRLEVADEVPQGLAQSRGAEMQGLLSLLQDN